MKNFWKFLLRKSLPSDSLSSLNFGVIGLGDSSYSKFNFVAKRLHKRLLQLGANAIEAVGLCDDQHDLGVGALLFPWLERFWKNLLEAKPLPTGLSPLEKSPRTTRWTVSRVQTFVAVDENQDIFADFEETPSEGYAEVVVSDDQGQPSVCSYSNLITFDRKTREQLRPIISRTFVLFPFVAVIWSGTLEMSPTSDLRTHRKLWQNFLRFFQNTKCQSSKGNVLC